jgi:hypothetical protein
MRAFAVLSLTTLALVGCKPPIEAPADLDELAAYMYANFGNEGTDELAAASLNLETILAGVELEGNLDGRSWSLTALSEADMGGISPTPEAEVDAQVPVAVAGMYQGSLEQAVELILDPNQVCIGGDGYVYYERRFDAGDDCFDGAGCELLEVTNVARYESLLADVWLKEQMESRWVELEDGRSAVVEIGWMEQRFTSDSGNATWDQRYGLDFYLPVTDGGDEVYRFFAFWSSADIPGVGEDTYANLAVSGIDEGFVNESAFTAGEDCSNDRDAEYEPPF